MKGQRGNPGLKGRLVEKSIEAYILALETVNRLSIQYRIETFCYLICNAWELLLKAKIVTDAGETSTIYYKKQPGKPRRSLSLRDCLNRTIPNQKDPVRRNIERIEELRDESVHLVIGQIPQDVIGLFQASVVNYHLHLGEWFGISLAERVPVGMMSIVYDMSPERHDLSDKRLRRKLGRDAADFLSGYCAELKEEFDQLQRPAEFSVGIEYRLVVNKKPDNADLDLSSGPTGVTPTQIVEVAKDPSTSHPFRETELIERLKATIPELEINNYDIRCVNKVHKIKTRPEYFYQGKVKGSPGQYSQSLADWIVKQHNQNEGFFHNARAKAKESA